jgi:hypothetical protein
VAVATSVRGLPVRLFTLVCVWASTGCDDEPTAVDTTPPGAILSLAAAASGGSVRLSWSNPADADVTGSLLVRFPASGVNATPTAGRTYAVNDALGSGRAVFAGRATEATDSPPCREQVYGAWARDAAGNWSATPQTVRVTGLPGSPIPAAPTSLAATIDAGGIALSWTIAGSAPSSVRLVRKRGAAPAGPADGDVVFAGSATSARDATPELNPQVTGHYAVFACNPCGDCESAGARTTVTPTLVQSLRAGGFVIFWRHALADVCEDKQSLGRASMPQVQDWWKSCVRDCAVATARQLNSVGFAQADSIGRALKARGVPFGRVLSSEYCRSIETATGMALGPQTETLREITFYVYFPEIDPCVVLPQMLAQRPAAGANTAIVAHTFVGCTDGGGMEPGIDSGEAWIYRPDGRGGASRVARVKAGEWGGLP